MSSYKSVDKKADRFRSNIREYERAIDLLKQNLTLPIDKDLPILALKKEMEREITRFNKFKEKEGF